LRLLRYLGVVNCLNFCHRSLLMLRRGSDGYARCQRPGIQRQAPQASPQSVVSGDNARQENRQKIHVVNGRSISLGHAEVKSPKRGAKSSLGGLSIELVKPLSAMASLTGSGRLRQWPAPGMGTSLAGTSHGELSRLQAGTPGVLRGPRSGPSGGACWPYCPRRTRNGSGVSPA
jgi:hypothetical protein